MSEIVIEYSEMEQLYLTYQSLESAIGDCIASVSELGALCQETFVTGISADHLTDSYREANNSVVGFIRIVLKLSDLQTLAGMCKVYIEDTENVMASMDQKISDAIITNIMEDYNLSRDEAIKVWNEYKEQI